MKQLALSINGSAIPVPGNAPSGGSDILQKIIQYGTTLLLIGVVLLALTFLIWGGIQWTTSGGDKQKIQQARLRITFAIVGLIVSFLAFFIVSAVGTFLGVKLF